MIQFPSEIAAGTTLRVSSITVEDCPASDGWAMTLVTRGADAGDKANISGVVNGNGWDLTVPAATTAGWAPGRYWWAITLTHQTTGEVYEVQRGTLSLLPSVAGADTFDGSTHAERTLSAIEAVIEKRASVDQQSYKIGGRELVRMPIADLLRLRSQYRDEVRAERRRGQATPFRQIKVSF